MNNEVSRFIDRYIVEIEEGNAAIFAGAGLSIPAGYVNWKELIRPLAEDLEVDLERESDLISVAQFHVNENGRNLLNQQLIDCLSPLSEPTENHHILARLPIRFYWTTNYDKLIEKSLEINRKIPDVKYTINQLAITKKGRDAVIYKMHGDIEHPDSAIVTKDDYEKYHVRRSPFVNALSGDLVSKTFLFLGFSFSDPNLDYILSRVRISFQDNQRQHYCILKRVARDDFDNSSEPDSDYIYAKIKQELIVKDLKRFNIKTLLIDQYSEITRILSSIESRFKSKTVFLSGSAHEYGSWGREKTERFLFRLGRVLINDGFRIASGIGVGIGNSFLTGAIQEIYSSSYERVDDRLIMRPFPQHISDPTQRESTWDNYRKDIIRQAGIAIFFMGNKQENGNITLADGVRKEFDIARQNGLYVFPVGSSDYMAKELWTEVRNDMENFFYARTPAFEELFERLGYPVNDPIELIEPINEIIRLATRG